MNQENTKSSSRRRFLLKSAVVSAPVIMSAMSRPVLAAKCSLSGMQSGNLSRDQDIECVLGKSPGYWMNHPESWPSPFLPDDLFSSVFPYSTEHDGYTMMQVMQDRNSNTYGPAFHVISALLNAHEWMGTYVLSVENVHQLYHQYLNGEISSSDLRSFLDTTWT